MCVEGVMEGRSKVRGKEKGQAGRKGTERNGHWTQKREKEDGRKAKVAKKLKEK